MAPCSILVVDDDVDIATNVDDILSDSGYRVDVTHDGTAALELVQRHSYDVALLDFRMPDMDGVTLYERIREIQPSLVGIIVTAYSNSDGLRRARDAGTWQVLRKPVDLPNLLALVHQVVHQPMVLVVDDDADFCDSIWEVLRQRGIRVSLARSESEAIARLEEHRFDVVLLDLLLGPHDSSPVFASLSDMPAPPKTVLITGDRRHRPLAEEWIQQGAHCLCLKPLDMPHLLQTIDALLP